MQETTIKTISTISYNTELYLIDKLDALVNANMILYYFFIRHYPEKDEGKAHFHLLVEPNGKINLVGLRDYFREPDLEHPEKPLGVMPFRITNDFGDWYLYSLHDEDYLNSKGLEKEYHYTHEQFIVSDSDIFNELIGQISFKKYKKDRVIVSMLDRGCNDIDILRSGALSMKEYYQYEKALNIIKWDYARKMSMLGFEKVKQSDNPFSNNYVDNV